MMECMCRNIENNLFRVVLVGIILMFHCGKERAGILMIGSLALSPPAVDRHCLSVVVF